MPTYRVDEQTAAAGHTVSWLFFRETSASRLPPHLLHELVCFACGQRLEFSRGDITHTPQGRMVSRKRGPEQRSPQKVSERVPGASTGYSSSAHHFVKFRQLEGIGRTRTDAFRADVHDTPTSNPEIPPSERATPNF